MRFAYKRTLAAGASADPDPRSAPATVQQGMLTRVPATLPGTDQPPRRLLLAAEGTAGQSIDVELWAVEETAAPATPNAEDAPFPAPGDRRFYEATTTDLTIGVGALRAFLLDAIPSGQVYVRVTSAPAAASTLKLGWA